MWTLDQAITNWHYCFTSGYLTAARAWWQIVEQLRRAEAGNLPADVASVTYPIFGKFAAQVEALDLPAVVLDLGATMADELAAALA